MGSDKTPVDVMFDTGSDWLTIPDDSCNKCSGRTYDSSKSGDKLYKRFDQRAYGEATLEGYTYYD